MKTQKQIMKKVLGAMLALVLVMGIVPIQTQAASFSGGKGTKGDPYIVTTAEQFNSIRNDLAKHYKLGANIDLSKIGNWKPIGTWKTAFTGSLTCPTDKSGKPIYAITGLNCTISPPGWDKGADYRYEDYKADGSSGWEAGLFGVINKASLTNIIVLDAKVTNHVAGRSQVSLWNGQEVNNMVSQQCTGTMVGAAISATIKNCGVTGTITSTSNRTGGFAGTIIGNSRVNRCYAIVNVNEGAKTGGEWFTGGFVGSFGIEAGEDKLQRNTSGKPSVTECYASGTVGGSWCNTGGFCGGVGANKATISDCYNEGHVTDVSSGRSFTGYDPKHTTKGGVDTCVKNCYTRAGLVNKGNPSTAKGMSHSFVATEPGTKGTYPFQDGFTAADKATIAAAFQSNPLWTIGSDGWPVLKNLHIIKQVSELGTASEATTGDAATGDTTTGDTTTGDTTTGDTTTGDTATEDTGKNNVQTVIVENGGGMSQAERMLVIILLIAICVLVLASVITIIQLQIFGYRQKKKIRGNMSTGKEKQEDIAIEDIVIDVPED